MKKTVSALALAFILAGCENPLNTMGEMKDTTKGMSQTTQEMSVTTKDMKSITNSMYVSLRQQASEMTRNEKLFALLDPRRDMGDNLTDARIMFMAYEFQVWYGKAQGEQLHEREELILHAIEELYSRISVKHETLVESGRLEDMSPLDLAGPDKTLERMFYAIATTMHFTNEFQKVLIRENENIGVRAQEISVYDVIKSALLKDAGVEPGELSEAESYVTTSAYKRLAVDLLKARMDFLTALAIKCMVDKDNIGAGEMARGLLFKISGGRLGGLEVKNVFAQGNKATREDVLTKLNEAIKAKELLDAIGERPMLQIEIKSILENLELAQDDGKKSYGSALSEELAQDNRKLNDAIERLLANE